MARQLRAIQIRSGAVQHIDTVSFDHPDPSIFTVLTSPSETPGTANVDFVIFPPRWMVAEHTFRPPWFHRNVMSEFMGLIFGHTTPRPKVSFPAAPACTIAWQAHGPDAATFEKACDGGPEAAVILSDTLAFMFESRYVSPHEICDGD